MSDIRYNQWLHNSGTGGVSQDAGGNIGIGTTAPLIPVGAGNTAILNVGVVTCNSIEVTGNVSVGGTLTYQDVTNIDSVGIITARDVIDAQGYINLAQKIIHTGDADTSIEFGTDTIKFETAGSERLNIASNGDVTITNTSSNPQLALISANNGISEIQFGDGADAVRGNIVYRSGSAGDALCFNGYNNTERLRIDSSGNVNFGAEKAVALPSGTGIQVYSSATPRIKLVNDTTGNAAGDGFQLYLSGSGVFFDHKEDAEMRFYTNAIEKLRITKDGEVLIGRTAWGSNLHPNDINKLVVVGASPADSFDSQCHLEGSETSGAVDTGGALAFAGHDGSQYRNWANIWGMKENGTGGNTASYMAFHTRVAGGSPAEKMRIDSRGALLIGQTSSTSSSKLCVRGAISTPEAFFELNRTDDPANGQNVGVIEFSQGSAASRLAARIMTRRDGGVWGAASLPTRFEFHTCVSGSNSASEKVRITSTGQLQINHGNAAKMSFYHDAAGSMNHITSNNGNEIKVSSGNGTSNGIEFWDYTGVNKRCQIDGHGIKFNADTSENNALDDYEEGSWTPTYGGTHSGISGNQRHARYTKIGNIVFYSLEYYNSSNAGSWSSGFEIGGMPHASSLSELYCSPSIGVMYGPGSYSMDEDASGRIYHLGSQNKIYFKFGTSGVRHLWISFFHRVEN